MVLSFGRYKGTRAPHGFHEKTSVQAGSPSPPTASSCKHWLTPHAPTTPCAVRWAQVARCFRDEDLRADRQPEFTQLDLEVSFMDAQAIQDLMEGLIVKVFRDVAEVELQTPFPRMTYQEAMERWVVGRQGL